MTFATLALIALAGAAASSAEHAAESPTSNTVIGLQSSLLAAGATALAEGRAEDGVRLTLAGLKYPSPVQDQAAAHANLCAGYVLLHRLEEALAECDTSIALDGNNWRAYNNRAAVFTAQERYDAAVADILVGLKLAPQSAVLRKSLEIIYRDEKIHRDRSRSGLRARVAVGSALPSPAAISISLRHGNQPSAQPPRASD